MRRFYCKHHNWFLTVDKIEKDKENRCYRCKHFVRITGRNTHSTHNIDRKVNGKGERS